MSKIGVVTVFKGYNYGSALQAYAVKCTFEKFGLDVVVLEQSGSLIKGRDVRILKILRFLINAIFSPIEFRKTMIAYKNIYNNYKSDVAKKMFIEFWESFIRPKKYSYQQLVRASTSDEYMFFVCGSDQIWSVDATFVDPFYYIRFASKEKRVAFAPSLGKDSLPKRNIKILRKYIGEIPHLSVREYSGSILIKQLTGRDAEVLVDPTLLISPEEWRERIKINHNLEPYILVYFLSKPSQVALSSLERLQHRTGLKIKYIGFRFDEKVNVEDAGPKEFVEYISNATYVITDSFHGVVFSIIFNRPFSVFERDYGGASSQLTRIDNILLLFNLSGRLNASIITEMSADEWVVVNKMKILYIENSMNFIRNVIKDKNDGYPPACD